LNGIERPNKNIQMGVSPIYLNHQKFVYACFLAQSINAHTSPQTALLPPRSAMDTIK